MQKEENILLGIVILAALTLVISIGATIHAGTTSQESPKVPQYSMEAVPSGEEVIESKYEHLEEALTERGDLPYADVGREDPLSGNLNRVWEKDSK